MSYYSNTKLDAAFGSCLVKKGIISQNVFDDTLHTSKTSKDSFIRILVDEHRVSEVTLYSVLTQDFDYTYLELSSFDFQKDLIQTAPIKIAWHYAFMPVQIREGVLTIAVEYPLNTRTLDEIQLQLGVGLNQVLSNRKEILDALKRSYGLAADTAERIISGSDEDDRLNRSQEPESIDRLAGEASVVNLVNEIIYEAYQRNATDIHFEPYRGDFRLRYRIDGILQDANLSEKSKNFILPILSRIKIMADLDIVEHRLPQDGRALVKVKDHRLDLRVSTLPTPNGESIVVRVLPMEMTYELKRLGLTPRNIEIFDHLLQKPHGIILLTGPTGSGKTTTLYACLNQLNTKDRKIVTIEDPVEYEIQGITQIQTQPKIGLDFATGLRSMLRHDPDVMMVGEIRDYETAEISNRSALTGHLVFSTLHTNDAASAVTRLLEIGLEPFLVASSLESVIAQRLVRVICSECRTEDKFAHEAMKVQIARELGMQSHRDIKIYTGRGCRNCNQTGYKGRTAIHEILELNEGVRDLILKKSTSIELQKQAIACGMETLRQDGWRKVIAGVTTPSEVLNVVKSETSGLSNGDSHARL